MKEDLYMLEMRIGEAFADKSFIKKLSRAQTPEEARTLLSEKGIELSLDNVRRLPDELERMRGNGDELGEDELENVAGGMTYPVMGIVASEAVIRAVGANFKRIRGW